ncbi:hypothetical protein [Agrobacterium vaccinii]|uniref:hypothetical protein n=1 Tax=Agrobacterium vaccinii TaxID=2735528 RepID=UPI001E364235|nr:hypothetical protein [Agrobacterium vaccinii]
MLHQIENLHGCHDGGDVAMHLQARSLVARCLADYDSLNEIPHDRHEALFGVFVGIGTGKEQQLADCDLDIIRIKLLLQLADLPLKILRRRFGSGKLQGKLLTRDFQSIQLVVEDGKARSALGMPVLDLLHQTCLCRFDFCKFCSNLIFAGGEALQLSDLMSDHLLRNPVEDIDGIECDRNAIEDALFEFLARDGFAVPTAFAAKLVDR